MTHLAWLIGLLPLLCGCEACDGSVICFLAAFLVAGVAFVLLSLSRELYSIAHLN